MTDREHGESVDAAPSKSKKYSRYPSAEELARFDGLHCARKYAWARANGWRCPSCARTAEELVRWSEIRGPSWRARYGDAFGMGFTVHMAEHHCHGGGRFPRVLMCGDCNSADGIAKRKLKLPADWTFSPAEIARFVTVTPYSGHTVIDYVVAKAIFDRNPRFF